MPAKFGLVGLAMKQEDATFSAKRDEFACRCCTEFVRQHREEADAKLFQDHPWPVVNSSLLKEFCPKKADGGIGGRDWGNSRDGRAVRVGAMGRGRRRGSGRGQQERGDDTGWIRSPCYYALVRAPCDLVLSCPA